MYLLRLCLILFLGVVSLSVFIRYLPVDSHGGTIYIFICKGKGSTLLFKFNEKIITIINEDDLVNKFEYIRSGNTSGCFYKTGLLSSHSANNDSELVAVLVAYDCQNSSFEITCSNQEQSEVVHTAERNGLHSSPIDTDFSVNIVLDHLFTENIIHRSNKTLLTHVFSCLVNETYVSIKVNDKPPYGFGEYRFFHEIPDLSDDGSFIEEVAILLTRETENSYVLLFVTSSNNVTVRCSTPTDETSLTVNTTAATPTPYFTQQGTSAATPNFTQQDDATTANVNNGDSNDLGIIPQIVIYVISFIAAVCLFLGFVVCCYWCKKKLFYRENFSLPSTQDQQEVQLHQDQDQQEVQLHQEEQNMKQYQDQQEVQLHQDQLKMKQHQDQLKMKQHQDQQEVQLHQEEQKMKQDQDQQEVQLHQEVRLHQDQQKLKQHQDQQDIGTSSSAC